MKPAMLTCLLSCCIIITFSKNPSIQASSQVAKNTAPLSFIENKGQVTDQYRQGRHDIQFSIKATRGLNIFIGSGAIHYQFSKAEANNAKEGNSSHVSGHQSFNGANDVLTPVAYSLYRMDVELVGANKNAQVITEEKQDYYENYFTDVTGPMGAVCHAFTKITYKNVYPDIDWVFKINNGKLEHEFVVNPGGNAGDIQLSYGGTTGLKINAEGNLTATTPQGNITELSPSAYTGDGKMVKSGFKLNGNILSYSIDNYNGVLIIDPALLWSTYYGGGRPYVMAMGGNSLLYLTGSTDNISGIATVGAYQTSFAGDYDAFLTKFDSTGFVKWGTYYGGSGYDEGLGVATDKFGNSFISGVTASTSGIATAGAHQTVFTANISNPSLQGDAYLAKFDSSGSLLWGTYFGGRGYQQGRDLVTDDSGNVYMSGQTTCDNIATPGAYQTVIGDTTLGGDAYLSKFSGAGVLQWATYFGGGQEDAATGTAIDADANVYIIGFTLSATGIATSGAYQTTYGGGSSTGDAFLAKFSRAGNILWATYYGGSGEENGSAATTDGNMNVFIAGSATSKSGIATPGVYQDTLGGGHVYGDAFIVEFDSTGSRQWGTYYGGPTDEFPYGISADATGDVFITGFTSSSSGIATPGAYDTVYSSPFNESFLADFSNTGSIHWATYFGGTSDGSSAIADNLGNLYFTGTTKTDSDVATPGTYQPIFTTGADGVDGFLAKFKLCNLGQVGLITGPLSVCQGSGLTLSDTSQGGVWGSNNIGVATVNSSGMVSGVSGGVVAINYSITNTCGINRVTAGVTINSSPVAGIIQSNDTLTASVALHYQWYLNDVAITGDTGQQLIITANGNYKVEVTDSTGCSGFSANADITSLAISSIAADYGVQIFPNPGSGKFNILFSDLQARYVSVTDIQGQVVIPAQKISGGKEFDLGNISAGIYLLQINGGEGIKTFKVVITR